MLTWNNPPEDGFQQVLTHCAANGCHYAFQEETGDNGTPHLQIWFYYPQAQRWTKTKIAFPTCHIEYAKKGPAACIRYCTKLETRTGRVWCNCAAKYRVTIAVKARDPLHGKELRPWQAALMEMIKGEPDDRKIVWYIDRVGGKGKSVMAKHLVMKHDALLLSGKEIDMKHGIRAAVDAGNPGKIILFDITREAGIEDRIPYSFMEQAKNGLFFSPKYESKMVWYDAPHLVVFANREPDQSKMSADRWDIRDLDAEQGVQAQAVFSAVAQALGM